MPARNELIARIRQIRRVSPAGQDTRVASPVDAQDDLKALQARVMHLEQLVEGLQDSVHRESTRLGKRVADVEARIQPAVPDKEPRDDAR